MDPPESEQQEFGDADKGVYERAIVRLENNCQIIKKTVYITSNQNTVNGGSFMANLPVFDYEVPSTCYIDTNTIMPYETNVEIAAYKEEYGAEGVVPYDNDIIFTFKSGVSGQSTVVYRSGLKNNVDALRVITANGYQYPEATWVFDYEKTPRIKLGSCRIVSAAPKGSVSMTVKGNYGKAEPGDRFTLEYRFFAMTTRGDKFATREETFGIAPVVQPVLFKIYRVTYVFLGNRKMDVYHKSSPNVVMGSNYNKNTNNFGTMKIEMNSAFIGNPDGQGCVLTVRDYQTNIVIGVLPVSPGTMKIDLVKDFYNVGDMYPGKPYLFTFRRENLNPITKTIDVDEGGMILIAC
jgi:hypothetical protein